MHSTPDYIAQAQDRMREALSVAHSTPAEDIPVGALILGPDGTTISSATNLRESTHNPVAHAETLAIERAADVLGDSWRLEDCTLVVTLEPCAMCAGAAVNARMGKIIFGAYEPKTGACGSQFDIPRESLLHRPEVLGGILEQECQKLLKDFFGHVRSNKP